MTFDFLSWATGYSLNRIGINSEDAIKYKPLSKKLDDIVVNWAKDLPNDKSLVPKSIFPKKEVVNNEALISLRKKLSDKELPSAQDWSCAILRQWEIIKSEHGGEAQNFYLITKSEAQKHINQLSSKLHQECVFNSDLFKSKVITELSDSNRALEAIKNLLWIIIMILLGIFILFYFLLRKKTPKEAYETVNTRLHRKKRI